MPGQLKDLPFYPPFIFFCPLTLTFWSFFMIAVIDYDMGNLRSVSKALEKVCKVGKAGKSRVGAKVRVTSSPGVIADATHVVLPGVGAFKECMRNLEERGLVEAVLKAIESGKPFLGICLGLQLLFDESTEDGLGGSHRGLGVIKGRVVKFPEGLKDAGYGVLKVPHMGWNSIKKKKDSPLLKDVPEGSYFYFVHSYYAVPDDPSIALTTTDYGSEFVSSIEKDNVMACQFHPEKSQDVGLKILKDFIELS